MTQRYGGSYRPRARPVTTGSNLGVVLAFVAAVVFLLVGAAKMGVIKFGATSAATGTSPKSGGSSGKPSGDAAAILKQARKYDGLSYVWGGGHPPNTWHESNGLDCSGLIDVAVLKVTGINENNAARSFRDSGHWTSIKMSEARLGDIVYLLKERHSGHSADHVAIVVNNKGGHLTLFEAYTNGIRQDLQIREWSGYTYGNFDGALRFHR